MNPSRRLNVKFTGEVQGVGFRFMTVQVARQHRGITGYVRNLSDGSVEVVAEGPPDKAMAFIRAVQDQMNAYIHDVELREEPATGEFSNFTLEY